MKAESKQLQQGSLEWQAHRAKHFNASDAAAMLGLSKYKTRGELLREKATGIVPEVDDATQARFDRGHEIEALARPIAEEIIGSELYPLVYSADVDGLPLSASLDGITMLEDVTWECKTANNALLDAMVEGGVIPIEYWPQMEQALLLTGATKCLFTASDGTKEGTVEAWYEPRPELRKQLLDGWKQFAEDLASYQHVETPAEVVGATVEAMPVPVLQVEGRVVASNMDAFKLAAGKFLDRLPKATELETDQDFADADKAVKACEDAEDRLKLVKAQAQAQAVEIDEVFRAIDQIGASIRDARLALTKAVTKRKDDIRVGLVMQANKDLAEHVKKLNTRLGGEWMPVIDGEFQAAIKGKKTLTGLRDALGTAMANAKIKANEIADTIQINRDHLTAQYAAAASLAPDFKAICTKSREDFANMLAQRHRQQEEERERIRKEEAEKLAKAEQDQRGKASTEDVKPVPDTRTADAPGAVSREDEGTQVGKTSTPPDNGKTLKLGEISARLGFTVTADFLERIGYPVHATEKNAKLYRECDFPGICMAIISHIRGLAA